MELFGTAAILAGGRSSRMGFDKQGLLTARIAAQLMQVFPDILMVTARPELYFGLRTTADEFAGMGPLAGIQAALKNAGSRYVYITACDMPYFSEQYALRLMELAARLEPPAIVTGREGGLQPFQALYSRSLLPEIEADLAAGLTSPRRLLSAAGALVLPDGEAPDIFFGLNTPADLAGFRHDRVPAEQRGRPCRKGIYY